MPPRSRQDKRVTVAAAPPPASIELPPALREALFDPESWRESMAERQRLEYEAQRAEHFALLGRLAAGVCHEIRNPLAAVFLHADLLEEELCYPTPDNPMAVAKTPPVHIDTRYGGTLPIHLGVARMA